MSPNAEGLDCALGVEVLKWPSYPTCISNLSTMSLESVPLEKDDKVSASASVAHSVDSEAASGHTAAFKRHGRVDLVPMPSDDPQDPLNWPS